MSVKFCPHCGSGLATEGNYCGSCGKPLMEASGDSAQARNESDEQRQGLSDRTIVIFLFVGGAIAIVLICVVLGRWSDEDWSSIHLSCYETDNMLQCGSTNWGLGKGKMCFNAVLVCEDGRHTAHACTPMIESWEHVEHVVDEFDPVIPAGTNCPGLELDK